MAARGVAQLSPPGAWRCWQAEAPAPLGPRRGYVPRVRRGRRLDAVPPPDPVPANQAWLPPFLPTRCANRRSSVLCARFRREATVPAEQPRTSEISAYDNPSVYRRMMAIRRSGARRSTADRIRALTSDRNISARLSPDERSVERTRSEGHTSE